MSRKYQLIALDMDGTVLNDRKEIDAETRSAIHEALAAGVEVVFCTGRSFSEMRDILKDFPDMHYLCGESGALVLDLQKGETLHREEVSREIAEIMMAAGKRKDLMTCVFSDGICCVKKEHMLHMDRYQMGQYQKMYEKTCNPMEGNVLERLLKEEGPDHNKQFQVGVLIGDIQYGTGNGRTKKAAEQDAAYQAILKIKGGDTCI